ncbi:unnamed protein product [Staurois parvus]|uniref:Uncharacterized protein n=1 Tax=Staurois parvus TaxID=386267 RepID=A0ABN9FU87_9NEOB|nr:unnamed protein product [Staurois parvus]
MGKHTPRHRAQAWSWLKYTFLQSAPGLLIARVSFWLLRALAGKLWYCSPHGRRVPPPVLSPFLTPQVC